MPVSLKLLSPAHAPNPPSPPAPPPLCVELLVMCIVMYFNLNSWFEEIVDKTINFPIHLKVECENMNFAKLYDWMVFLGGG